jgi:hypothetical protein
MSASSALLAGRTLALSLMVDAITFTRATGTTTFDETTGRETAGAATTVYTGPCKVQRQRVAPADPEAGERTVTVEQVEVHVPVETTEVRIGDVGTITSAVFDPALVGRKFRVTGLFHKSWATARRLRCDEVTG